MQKDTLTIICLLLIAGVLVMNILMGMFLITTRADMRRTSLSYEEHRTQIDKTVSMHDTVLRTHNSLLQQMRASAATGSPGVKTPPADE